MILESPPAFCNFDTANHPRPHKTALVAPHKTPTIDKDVQWKLMQEAGFNTFNFPADELLVDLLSDSGTTTLTVDQLAKMVLCLGKEAYGSPFAYKDLVETMRKIFGMHTQDWEIYFFHQGRTAEHALFSPLGKLVRQKSHVVSNGHFDTTRANIIANDMIATDIATVETRHESEQRKYRHFLGSMDDNVLALALDERKREIPLVYSTITNNRVGGLAVSLQNLKLVRALCNRYNKPFFLDACRFAENAWFIKRYEPEYKDKTIQEIVHEMFSLCDGFTISFKKDGLSHMGGALVIRKQSHLPSEFPELLNMIRDHQLLTEGNDKQGGMTLFDMASVAEGLTRVVEEDYLNGRIEQVGAFGMEMARMGIPVIQPFGGHAIYIDTDKFFEGTKMKREDFGGIALTALLLLKGVRACELGAFAFGTWNPKTRKEEFSGKNLVRCAVPRNKYEEVDLQYVADCVRGLFERRDQIPRAVPVYGRDLTLRHFKARFKLESM
ncbi:MAG: tryptophanase [bacterium]|nr:tryptophanase [bacterium]